MLGNDEGSRQMDKLQPNGFEKDAEGLRAALLSSWLRELSEHTAVSCSTSGSCAARVASTLHPSHVQLQRLSAR